MKYIKYLILLFSFLLLVGCEPEKPVEPEKTSVNKGDYEVGETFMFKDFQVKIGKYEGIVTVDREMSSDHGKKAVKVPVEITNKGTIASHISMFNYKFYDDKGREIQSLAYYFGDSLDYSPDLQPGESYTRYLYIPYQDSGKHVVELNDFVSKKKIIIDVR